MPRPWQVVMQRLQEIFVTEYPYSVREPSRWSPDRRVLFEEGGEESLYHVLGDMITDLRDCPWSDIQKGFWYVREHMQERRAGPYGDFEEVPEAAQWWGRTGILAQVFTDVEAGWQKHGLIRRVYWDHPVV